jgi:phosphohistidine phosphatase
MFISLLRHAAAAVQTEAGVPDDDRPLTKEGRKKMTAAAHGIVCLIPAPVDVVLTSPLRRARETAEIAADVLRCEKKVAVCPELAPGISHAKLMKALAKYKTCEHLMLVGHSPALNSTIASLLGSDAVSVEMKKGALCCIEMEKLSPRTKGTLLWLMQPKQLRRSAK